MRNISTAKLLIIIFISNIVESILAPYLIGFYINLPLAFLVFSLAIYNSNYNSNPLFAFLYGFYLDLISGSPFGINAGLFTMMSYVVNSYANTFKLFSYIQICVFFSMSSIFYIGFKNLFISLENFSYLVLFFSFIFNTFLFLLIAMIRYYFPSKAIKYD